MALILRSPDVPSVSLALPKIHLSPLSSTFLLLSLDAKYSCSFVLRKRSACPVPRGINNFGKDGGKDGGNGKDFEQEEAMYEETKLTGIASGGYLIGRHPECGKPSRVVHREEIN